MWHHAAYPKKVKEPTESSWRKQCSFSTKQMYASSEVVSLNGGDDGWMACHSRRRPIKKDTWTHIALIRKGADVPMCRKCITTAP